jgi:atypical dual specificity phosphatase
MNNNDKILEEIRFGFLSPYKIAGMGEPWSMKLDLTFQLLKQKGIGAILTLTEDDLYGPDYVKSGFIHHHEPIDDCEPPDNGGMDRAIGFIDSSLKNNIGVSIHCYEGRGRTGTILCGWIGLKESLEFEDALKRLYELRPHNVITPSQRAFLSDYLKKWIT